MATDCVSHILAAMVEIEDLTFANRNRMRLTEAKDALALRVGRNVLLFQQLERHLKLLVIEGEFAGPVAKIQASQIERKQFVSKQTLGSVTGEFFERNHPNYDLDFKPPEDVVEAYLGFNFVAYDSYEEWDERKATLRNLVSERNELVHHFLDRVDHRSVASLLEASKFLDDQSERIRQEVLYFGQIIELLLKARQELGGGIARHFDGREK